jgi:hypothetical protein
MRTALAAVALVAALAPLAATARRQGPGGCPDDILSGTAAAVDTALTVLGVDAVGKSLGPESGGPEALKEAAAALSTARGVERGRALQLVRYAMASHAVELYRMNSSTPEAKSTLENILGKLDLDSEVCDTGDGVMMQPATGAELVLVASSRVAVSTGSEAFLVSAEHVSTAARAEGQLFDTNCFRLSLDSSKPLSDKVVGALRRRMLDAAAIDALNNPPPPPAVEVANETVVANATEAVVGNSSATVDTNETAVVDTEEAVAEAESMPPTPEEEQAAAVEEGSTVVETGEAKFAQNSLSRIASESESDLDRVRTLARKAVQQAQVLEARVQTPAATEFRFRSDRPGEAHLRGSDEMHFRQKRHHHRHHHAGKRHHRHHHQHAAHDASAPMMQQEQSAPMMQQEQPAPMMQQEQPAPMMQQRPDARFLEAPARASAPRIPEPQRMAARMLADEMVGHVGSLGVADEESVPSLRGHVENMVQTVEQVRRVPGDALLSSILLETDASKSIVVCFRDQARRDAALCPVRHAALAARPSLMEGGNDLSVTEAVEAVVNATTEALSGADNENKPVRLSVSRSLAPCSLGMYRAAGAVVAEHPLEGDLPAQTNETVSNGSSSPAAAETGHPAFRSLHAQTRRSLGSLLRFRSAHKATMRLADMLRADPMDELQPTAPTGDAPATASAEAVEETPATAAAETVIVTTRSNMTTPAQGEAVAAVIHESEPATIVESLPPKVVEVAHTEPSSEMVPATIVDSIKPSVAPLSVDSPPPSAAAAPLSVEDHQRARMEHHVNQAMLSALRKEVQEHGKQHAAEHAAAVANATKLYKEQTGRDPTKPMTVRTKTAHDITVEVHPSPHPSASASPLPSASSSPKPRMVPVETDESLGSDKSSPVEPATVVDSVERVEESAVNPEQMRFSLSQARARRREIEAANRASIPAPWFGPINFE